MSDNTISSTTQEFLDVYDITNDMVILKDGVVSIVMQIGTMNFSLLAEQEQDAIMYTYGALLNSLNFPIQINIQSNIKDATKYLRLLENQAKQAKSREKALLVEEYRNFVANLIRERNVLEKKFFVVIPTNAGEMGLYTAESVLPGKTKFNINNFEKTILIEKASTILDPRRDHLIAQFNRIGLFARQLDTQEIIQNFYINYNPESIEGQEVTNSESYTTPMVRASLTSNQNFSKIDQAANQTPVSTPTSKIKAELNETPASTKTSKTTTSDETVSDPNQISNQDLNKKTQQTQIISRDLSETTSSKPQISPSTNFSEEITHLQTTNPEQKQNLETNNEIKNTNAGAQDDQLSQKMMPPSSINQILNKNEPGPVEL
jgi:hypothetical protein